MATDISIDGTPTNGANPWIDSLVAGGRWVDVDGGVTTINVALLEGTDPYGQIWGGVEWFDYEITALSTAMATWEAVANIEFVATDAYSADIWYWLTDNAGLGGNLGMHEMPGGGSGTPKYGVFNYQGEGWDASGLQQGGYGFITLVHELGHGLGLAHPHDGAAGAFWDGTVFPGVTAAFGDYGDYGLNQGIWTMMSYNDGWASLQSGSYAYGWQGTPMALDIAAIQAIYGANTTHHTGSDTYVLPRVNGAGTFWSCVWDAGGTDTISASAASNACAINLNAAPLIGPNAGGFISTVSGIVGGYTIANGVVIENAVGGAGNDLLIGNSASNTLNGAGGADVMGGLAGSDTYVVDNKGDVVDESVAGSSGTDLVRSSVSFSLADVLHAKGAIENLILSGVAAINAIGNTIGNILTGNAGINVLNGGTGADNMRGMAGNDVYVVDNASDIVNESVSGSNGTDIVQASISFNLANTARVFGAVENLTLLGSGNINGTGNTLNNVLTGNAGINALNGAAGSDTLNGGAGNDMIYGGAGNDRLVGGAGYDNFVFNTAISAATNVDTIFDFNVVQDTIRLDNAVMSALGSAMESGEFWKSTSGAAHDKNDRIIYETDTGWLNYDSNGSAAGGAVHIAKLAPNLALTYADFAVI